MEDDDPKTHRIIIPISGSMLEAIDAERVENRRIISRSEAVRTLLREALEARAKTAARRKPR